MNNIMQILCRERFIAILRGIPASKLERVAQALIDGGIRMMEVTFDLRDPDTIPKTSAAIARLREIGGGDVEVGAGTVLLPDEVDAVKCAGGTYIIAPNTSERVIRRTKKLGLFSIPGAYTPSEIVTAWELGADLVKIFPVAPDEIAYLKNIRAPLGHIPFITTGGVNPDTIPAFLALGATATAAGATVIPRAALDADDYAEITRCARAHIDVTRRFIAEHPATN